MVGRGESKGVYSDGVDIVAVSLPFIGRRVKKEEVVDDDEEVRPILPKTTPHKVSLSLLLYHGAQYGGLSYYAAKLSPFTIPTPSFINLI